jgi:hypothetical protein
VGPLPSAGRTGSAFVPNLAKIMNQENDNNSNLLTFFINRRQLNTYKTSQKTRVKKKTENGLGYL